VITLRHLSSRRLLVGMFLAVILLAPLKVVLACAMMDRVVASCCCEHSCKADCQPKQTKTDNYCHAIYLLEASLDRLSASSKAVTASPLDAPELPPCEVGADPPILAKTSASVYLATPPAWLQGSDIYLLTQRLRK
jgi:hypothetical protein